MRVGIFMTNIINSNNIGYTVKTTGIKQPDVQDTIEKSKQVVTENVMDNSLAKTLTGDADASSLKWVPILYAGDMFLNRSIGGKKGLLGYVADLGDKISNVLKLDNLFSKGTENKISGFLKKNKFTKYFTSDYKANPIMSMAKTKTMAQEYEEKLVEAITKVKCGNVSAKQLEKLNLSENAQKLFQQLGPTKNAITPEYIDKVKTCIEECVTAGITDKKTLESFTSSFNKFVEESNAGKEVSSFARTTASILQNLKAGYHKKPWAVTAQPIISTDSVKILNTVNLKQPEVIADGITDLASEIVNSGTDRFRNGIKSVSISELRNKLNASNLKTGKTGLGKLFAKGFLKAKDTFTYGGGWLSMLFLARSLGHTIKETKEAPKEEKKSTFMHVLSEEFIGMILFHPCTNLLYKICGNKYRGMTVEGRKALTNLVATSNAQILSNEARKIANIQKKLLIKGVDNKKVANLAGKSLKEVKTAAKSLGKEGAKLKLWERPLKFAGKILSTGLDTIKKPFVIKGIKLPHPTLKGFAGGLGRFLIITIVLQPLLQKPLTKLCHKIFGEPKTYLAKQKQKEEKGNNKTKKNDTGANPPEQTTNLLKLWDEKQQMKSQASSPLNQEDSAPLKPQGNEKPAGASKLKTQERYIPSSDFEFSYEDDAKTEQYINFLLNSTDEPMKKALEALKNN